jgi:hypothetical protein
MENKIIDTNAKLPLSIIFFGVAFIIASIFIANAVQTLRPAAGDISVKGYAEMSITSDWAKWDGSFSLISSTRIEGYSEMQKYKDIVEAYLLEQGFSKESIEFGMLRYEPNIIYLPNGENRQEGYNFYQIVSVNSANVNKIKDLSYNATELINRGIPFHSNEPQYSYTKLNDLKVKMLGMAAQDAKSRAVEIAKSGGSDIGVILSASQGIFQITSPGSNETSDYGINDLSSIDKTIKSVVTVRYSVK